jgi:hypothetical protein
LYAIFCTIHFTAIDEMIKSIWTLLIGVMLFSCSTRSNEKALHELLASADYNQTVKKQLSLYDTLKDIALSNIDTIFKFRNSHNIFIDENNGNITKKQRDELYYNFFYKSTTNEIVDGNRDYALPNFISPKFVKIFEQLGEKEGGFTLWRDSTLEVGLEGLFDNKTGANIAHGLVWNKRYSYDTESLIKDTIIAPGWTYYISVERAEGR